MYAGTIRSRHLLYNVVTVCGSMYAWLDSGGGGVQCGSHARGPVPHRGPRPRAPKAPMGHESTSVGPTVDPSSLLNPTTSIHGVQSHAYETNYNCEPLRYFLSIMQMVKSISQPNSHSSSLTPISPTNLLLVINLCSVNSTVSSFVRTTGS